MHRIASIATLCALLMTGAASAQTAEISVKPVNGTCPSNFLLEPSSTGGEDRCVQTAGGSSGSGTINLASIAGGGDDSDHGGTMGSDDDGDQGAGDHDSDSD